jgi:Na+:H+ antiporter, NhaA family
MRQKRISPLKGPVQQVIGPFQLFVQTESSAGILLLGSTLAALIWANSPWADSYHHFWHTPLSFTFGSWSLDYSLSHWINDGLMAVFFLFVGLEIKREILVGELAAPRQAALPIVAAIGGMIFPAGIYLWFNGGTESAAGWGIPMATDIAFALGILTLLRNVSPGLKIFLAALAIVDDLGAVLVIAAFYTHEISWMYLAAGAVALLALVALNFGGIRNPLAYIVLGVLLWYALLQSGVHATIAGVLLALSIPEASRIDEKEFVSRSRELLVEFERVSSERPAKAVAEDQQDIVRGLEDRCENVTTPLRRIEHQLHPWVSILIMPVFALANAGVTLSRDIVPTLTSNIALGIILGLIVGKQLGLTLFSWIGARVGFVSIPAGTRWSRIYAVSWLGGIGFTMSLFIANLAFEESPFLEPAKIGILFASLIAGTVGWILLRALTPAESQGQ